jgi:uncharacterized protein (TIGR04255 family)
LIQPSDKLPKFNKPPVAEVVLGVQFAPLTGMHVGHIGLLWEQFKSKFSRVEQQPRLPHMIERKGNPAPPALLPSVSIMSAADLIPRVWMLNDEGTELIQVQTDRFLRNWRRYHNDSIPYPSYETSGRPGFENDLGNFREFAKDQGLGELAVDQCEMTYINHIRPCGVWAEFAQLDKVFRGWGSSYPALVGSRANTIGCRVRHEVADDQGKYVGHLYVELDSGYLPGSNEELTPLFQFQLIVRGRPLGEGMLGVMQFMDFAHCAIVKSFTDVTTPEMHKVWERTQ